MKILIVSSGNSGSISPFIKEQADALIKEGINVNYFLIKGKGILGYFKNYIPFKKAINNFQPDIIHAHYGLSGLFANLQRSIPVVTTYHGSDINNSKILPFSKIAAKLSVKNIYVSQKLLLQVNKSIKNVLIPCGINPSIFYPIDKIQARKEMGFTPEAWLVLFSSSFTNRVKNYPLAKNAIEKLKNVMLIELKGYTREEVNLLLNACDAALMTSFTEGSPQFIKEAMACNCPIVCTDVGDVGEVIVNTEGCYIADFDAQDVANKLQQALVFNNRTNGSSKISHFENRIIALKILDVYQQILR